MKRLVLLALATTLAFAQSKPLAPPAKPAAPPAATPAKPAAPPATKVTPVVGGFVGNKSSKIFHTSACKSVGKMADKNKVTFGSKDEAVKAGFKPCKECKP